MPRPINDPSPSLSRRTLPQLLQHQHLIRLQIGAPQLFKLRVAAEAVDFADRFLVSFLHGSLDEFEEAGGLVTLAEEGHHPGALAIEGWDSRAARIIAER